MQDNEELEQRIVEVFAKRLQCNYASLPCVHPDAWT